MVLEIMTEKKTWQHIVDTSIIKNRDVLHDVAHQPDSNLCCLKVDSEAVDEDSWID